MKHSMRVLGSMTAVMVLLAIPVANHDPLPAKEAMEAAREQMRSQGREVGDGGFADFITEPDWRGACEVRVGIDSLEFRVRRSWRFGGWQVTEVKERPRSHGTP